MTKEDYMRLPKERLAELLVERDSLEDILEDKIAEKLAELLTKFQLQPLLQLPLNDQNPFDNQIVAYGCPTPYPTMTYATGNVTNQKDDEP